MAYRAWRGAIEFAGFPVHLALYSRVKGFKGQSFRQLSPAGNPIQQQLVDSITGEVVPRADLQKGHEIAKGEYVVMTPEALEQIDSGVKTSVAELSQFAPVDSIDWDLATSTYAVRPDKDAAGSDRSLTIMWNGLRATQLAYVSQVSLRGGADAILAIRADHAGMWAALIPFQAELYDVPEFDFAENEQAATLVEQMLATESYEDSVRPFAHGDYESEYQARRQAAIESVLDGKPVPVAQPKPEAEQPDLMAALTAAMAAPKAPAKSKTKTKKAKVAA